MASFFTPLCFLSLLVYRKAEVFWGETLIGTGVGPIALKDARRASLFYLQKHYYSLCCVKRYLAAEETEEAEKEDATGDNDDAMEHPTNEKTARSSSRRIPITGKNIGFKLLQSMGWEPGTALRPGGRIEPVVCAGNSSRRGFGGNSKGSTENAINLVETIDKYAISGSWYDLLFDAKMDSKQRAHLHNHAKALGLASKSHTVPGKTGKLRRLVVSRKCTPEFIAKQMLSGKLPENHAFHKKYKLFPPGSEENGVL